MRFSQATKDLLTRLSAKPTKMELVKLLAQTTNDRLISILNDFGTDMHSKPSGRKLKSAAKQSAILGLRELEDRIKTNSKTRLTRNEYLDLVRDMTMTINGEITDDDSSQKRAVCEHLIASLPGIALSLLQLKVLPPDKNNKKPRIVRKYSDSNIE